MERLTLDTKRTFQTIESFGVSGAWWAQVAGGWEESDPESGLPKRERLAQLLFDKERGIGLSCYRYNLGGGSAQSGKGAFSMPTRRTESFDTDGGYDWSRDANAVWMLRRAADYGVRDLVVFVNSPPERFTVNGMTHCDVPFKSNLAKERYPDFVRYCLDCVEHFRAEGIPVTRLSPVNEPVWKWTGGQEGCHYRPGQVRRLLRLFAEELDKRPDLDGLLLSGAENGDIRWFNKTYTRVMLGDKTIRARADGIDVHSYCVNPSSVLLTRLFGNRVAYLRRYRRWLDRRFPGVPVRTSEWTHMKGGRDWGMESALEQTKILWEDLTILNVTSWQNWIAVSDVDYCDGLLYMDTAARTFAPAKRYYALGQFSKFIEPGSVRIAADAGEKLQTAAFKKGNRIAAVVVNAGASSVEAALPEAVKEMHLTSETHALTPMPAASVFAFPPKSVATILIEQEG